MISGKISSYLLSLIALLAFIVTLTGPALAADKNTDLTTTEQAQTTGQARTDAPLMPGLSPNAGTIHVAIDGIKGEVHGVDEGQIAALSFKQGLSNTASGNAGGGGGAGKAQFSDIRFTHLLDQASPELMLACASGKHIKQVVFTFRRPGGAGYYQVTLEDVLISSVNQTTNSELVPVEEVSLNFAKIQWSYTRLPGGGIFKTGWNLLQNSPVAF